MGNFNENDFEQKLFKLKDSHDSIASLSNWCLSNVEHHAKIVTTWLGALKKVKMEHRILLFYLANDIIQYSKKKGLAFVSTFGPALQKATTMVRDPNVKNKILRIFKIWDERNVYDESFLVDLSSLLTRDPKAANRIDLEDFQPTLLYSRLKSCQTLEEDTDAKMKLVVDNKMPLTDTERLRTTLKNRKASEDVISEIDEGIKKIGAFISALEAEIKERSGLIDLLDISEQYYDKELCEAKTVSNAYKCFTNRVKTVKKKLDEKIQTLPSPVPTPSPTAPSPEPEADSEISDFTPGPGGSFMDGSLFSNSSVAEEFGHFYGRQRTDVFPAVPAFNGESVKAAAEIQSPVCPPAAPVSVPPINVPPVFNYFRPITDTTPPPPPPRPPAEPILDQSITSQYNTTFNDTADLSNCSSEGLKIEVITTPTKNQSLTSILESMVGRSNPSLPPPPVPPMNFGWGTSDYWESPESPPNYEKEGLPPPLAEGLALGEDVDMRSKDVDHRNLISLTGGVEQDWDFPHPEVNENEDMEMSDEDVGNVEEVAAKPDGFNVPLIEADANNTIDTSAKDIPEYQPIKTLDEGKKRNSLFLAPPPLPPSVPDLLQPQIEEEKLWNPFPPPPPAPVFEPPSPLGPKGFPDMPPVLVNAGGLSTVQPAAKPLIGHGVQGHMNPSPGGNQGKLTPPPLMNSLPGPPIHPPLGGPPMDLPTGGQPGSQFQQPLRGTNPLNSPPQGFDHPPPHFPPGFNRFPMQPLPPMPPNDGLLPKPVPSFDSEPPHPNQQMQNFDQSPTDPPGRSHFYGGYRPRFEQRSMGGPPFFRGSPYRSPGHQFRQMRPRYPRF